MKPKALIHCSGPVQRIFAHDSDVLRLRAYLSTAVETYTVSTLSGLRMNFFLLRTKSRNSVFTTSSRSGDHAMTHSIISVGFVNGQMATSEERKC
jgi:hypothetical protein